LTWKTFEYAEKAEDRLKTLQEIVKFDIPAHPIRDRIMVRKLDSFVGKQVLCRHKNSGNQAEVYWCDL